MVDEKEYEKSFEERAEDFGKEMGSIGERIESEVDSRKRRKDS